MKAKTFRIVTFSVVGFLLVVLIAANVALGIFGDILLNINRGQQASGATRNAGEELALQIQEEGSVLVRNEENTLPLNPENDVQLNVFGWAATQWIAGGSGSGRVVKTDGETNTLKPTTDFLTALTEAGLEYNEDLIDMYRDYYDDEDALAISSNAGDARLLGTGNAFGALHLYDYEFSRLYEPALEDYDTALLADAENYSDIAIVVLGRITGESNDAPTVQYKGSRSKEAMKTVDDPDRSYLEISTEEEALLKYVGEKYDKTIVLINSTNAMNLSFLESIPGLDSCLVVGGTGLNAVHGVVNLLYGEKMYEEKQIVNEDTNELEWVPDPLFGQPVCPSGRLTDTYVYDFKTNSSYVNSGLDGVGFYTNTAGGKMYPTNWTNGNVGALNATESYAYASYLDYAEGIYVGYKWYETADAEKYWDNVDNDYGKGYDGVVQYPFGYGLTYTDFTWEVTKPLNKTSFNFDDAEAIRGEELSMTVRVTNVGDVAAQEVVELYYNPPYTGKVEKSSVNLLAFGKTPVAVDPGESQDIVLTFTMGDMGSYDAYEQIVEGGGWVLEEGKYELSLRTDSHTVKTNPDGKGGTEEMKDAVQTIEIKGGDAKKYDAEQASNLFTGDSAKDYGISLDGKNTNANITYLSRSDFAGTFPKEKTANREADQKILDLNLYTDNNDLADQWLADVTKDGAITKPTMDAKNGIKLFGYKENNDATVNPNKAGTTATEIGLMLGSDYDDPMWEDVLDQLSESELKNLALHGYIHEEAVASVNKAETGSVDGPSQIGSFNVKFSGTGFPMPTVIGQTWNKELAKSFGYSVGLQTKDITYNGWYAPGVNLHRSPFGGRNYEYYSEDSYLSGVMGAMTVKGALNAGVYTYTKHIIGYDQESMRDGLSCWMTEQALRETYLKPFKILIDEGGATGLMSSYGRIGAVWSGGSRALLTELLRNEWNYHGTVMTDYTDHQDFMNADQMVRAGGDLWMDGITDRSFQLKDTSSPAFLSQLREGAHHILYMILNAQFVASEYVPGEDEISVGGGESGKFPLWTVVGILDGVIAAGCVVWVVFAILKKDKPAPDGAETSAEGGASPETEAPAADGAAEVPAAEPAPPETDGEAPDENK